MFLWDIELTLGWQFLSFSTLNMSFYWFLFSTVSEGNWAINLIVVALYLMSPFSVQVSLSYFFARLVFFFVKNWNFWWYNNSGLWYFSPWVFFFFSIFGGLSYSLSLLCYAWLLMSLLRFPFSLRPFSFFSLAALGLPPVCIPLWSGNDLGRGCAQTPWASKVSTLYLWLCVGWNQIIVLAVLQSPHLYFPLVLGSPLSIRAVAQVAWVCAEPSVALSFLASSHQISGWSASPLAPNQDCSQAPRVAHFPCLFPTSLLLGLSLHPPVSAPNLSLSFLATKLKVFVASPALFQLPC